MNAVRWDLVALGMLPVVDDLHSRRLVGVVTDRDIIVRGVAHEHRARVLATGQPHAGEEPRRQRAVVVRDRAAKKLRQSAARMRKAAA